MRISDWSSDVCSSDLHKPNGGPCRGCRGRAPDRPSRPAIYGWSPHSHDRHGHSLSGRTRPIDRRRAGPPYALARSEEHTSELQSLMRISYAVFCLKNKTYMIIQVIHTYKIYKANINTLFALHVSTN